MNKLGIICLLVVALLSSSCYTFDNPLDPINLPPIFVDHFNNLSEWTNTTHSTQDDAWFISTGNIWVSQQLDGPFAMSSCGGSGYGDQLSRVFNFSTNVVLKIWICAYPGWITVFVKVDGVSKIQYSSGLGWTQMQCNIPRGTHTISIETDYAGDAAVDEMEINAK